MEDISKEKESAEKEFELQKHKLWEHVEERLDRRTSRTRATFVFAVGVLGIIGIPSLFFALQSSVVSKVEQGIQEETKSMKDDLDRAYTELRRKLADCETMMDKWEKASEQLESEKKKLLSEYDAARKQTVSMIQEVRKTSRECICKARLAELDRALEEAWTDEQLNAEQYAKKLEIAVCRYQASMRVLGDSSIRPFLDVIDSRFLRATSAKDFKNIIKEAEIAVKLVINPTDDILAHYLLITAYILDPTEEDHTADIANTRSQLEAIMEKHKGFDLGGWEFDIALYREDKRDSITKLIDLIKTYVG